MAVDDDESVFVREIYELLERTQALLADLEKQPDEQELVRDIFISLHTIKGSAAMDGYAAIASYVHRLESFFDLIRSGKAKVTPSFIDAAKGALDQIGAMVEGNVVKEEEIGKPAFDLLITMHRALLGEEVGGKGEEQGADEKLRVLIVEDDFTTRNVFPRLLATCFPCECYVAVDGSEAIAAVSRALGEGKPYDLILMDIEMPVVDGQIALKSIRAMEKKYRRNTGQVRVFMTTGQDDRANVLAAFREQADAYIVKPVTREKILQEMARTGLAGRNQQRKNRT